jgi:hypothetical protein
MIVCYSMTGSLFCECHAPIDTRHRKPIFMFSFLPDTSFAHSTKIPNAIVGTDTEILIRLRAAIRQFVSGELTASEFKALVENYDLACWHHLRDCLEFNSQAAADVCCVLASLGEDYEANLKRLLLPYKVFQYHSGCYTRNHNDTDTSRLEDIPGYLALLYHTRQHADTLTILLELDMKGHPDYLEYVSALASLWELHGPALIRAASLKRLRRKNLEHALATLCTTVDEPTVWRSYYRDLQRLVYGRNRPLMWCARRIIASMKRAQKKI